MRRPTLHALAVAALAAGSLALAAVPREAAAQGAPVSRADRGAAAGTLSQLMAPWELEATGVARLSAEERRALEGWLGRYTAALRAGRPGAVNSLRDDELPLGRSAPMDTIRPEPGSRPARPGPPRRQPVERSTRIALSVDRLPNALEVVAVHDGGDIIETADGSLWETYLPDRVNAAAWRVGQQVVVRNNLLPPQLSGPAYDVVLQNGEARTSVVARYAGRQRVELGAEDGASTGEGAQAP
jgi:hypothetical protein